MGGEVVKTWVGAQDGEEGAAPGGAGVEPGRWWPQLGGRERDEQPDDSGSGWWIGGGRNLLFYLLDLFFFESTYFTGFDTERRHRLGVVHALLDLREQKQQVACAC